MYLVVFMTFVGMIIPGGSYRKYVEIVMGLVLIIVIITPIASLFGAEMRAGDAVTRFLEGDIVAITAHDEARFLNQRDHMLNENVNDMVAAQISALINDTGFSLTHSDVRFSVDDGEFLEIRLIVVRNEMEFSADTTPIAENRQFIRVERVEVSLRESRQSGRESTEFNDAETQHLRKIISDFYNVSQDNIHIEVLKTKR